MGKSRPRKKGTRNLFHIVDLKLLVFDGGKRSMSPFFAYLPFSAFCWGCDFFNRPTVPIFWHFAGPIQSMRYLAKGLSFFCDYALWLLVLDGGKRYQSPFFRLSAFFCFLWGRLLFQQTLSPLFSLIWLRWRIKVIQEPAIQNAKLERQNGKLPVLGS